MIKVRMILDNLLDSDNLHFSIYNEVLAIVSKCGKPLVMFRDIPISKKITNKELEFIKEILLKDIKDINAKLKELEKLEKDKPKEVQENYYNGNIRYILLVDNSSYERDALYFDINTEEVINYRIFGKTIDEFKNKMKKLDELFIKYKEYKKWLKKINEIKDSLNSCSI